MSQSLTKIFPQPTLTEIDGEHYTISPLKLQDLAYLHHILQIEFPHPFTIRKAEYFTTPTKEERIAILRECYLAARDYKVPGLDDPYMETPKGRMIFLNLLIKDIALDRLLEIVGKTYTDTGVFQQYQNIVSIAYEIDADRDLECLIESLINEQADDEPDDSDLWSVKVCEVAQRYGWTIAEVGYLSLKQFLLACRDGEVITTSHVSTNLQEAVTEAKKRRTVLFGEATNGDTAGNT